MAASPAMARSLDSVIPRKLYMRQPCERLMDLGYDKYVAVIVDGNSEQFKSLYLKNGFQSGYGAALDIRYEALSFLIQQGIYDPKATVLIYVYANFEAITKAFDGMNGFEKSFNFDQFQKGFQFGLGNYQAILAELDITKRFEMSCFKTLIHMFAEDIRCTNLILSGMPMEQCVNIRQDLPLNFSQQRKFRVAELRALFEEQDPSLRSRSSSVPTPAFEKLLSPTHIKSESLPVSRITTANVYQSPLINDMHGLRDPPSSDTSPSDDQIEMTKTVYRENRKANSKAVGLQQGFHQLPGLRKLNTHGPAQSTVHQRQPPVTIVPRDKHGRRLDPPLKPSQQLLDRIEGMRFCNNFHLKGGCTFQKCKHLHKIHDKLTGLWRDLTGEETETLRFIARRSPCRHGPSCNDQYCYAGHRCLNHIKRGKKECSFPENLHFEETPPINMRWSA